MKPTIWAKLYQELLDYGVDIKATEGSFVRKCLRQAYLQGKIDAYKEAITFQKKLS